MRLGQGMQAHGRGRVFGIVGGALIALSMGACSAATTSPLPSSADSESALASSSPVASPAATSTASMEPAATASLAPTLDPDASPTATPPLPTGPLPSVGPAPTGTWTGIDWLAIPGGHSPDVVPELDTNSNVTLEGWSHGYVEFVWDRSRRTVTPWASADGLTWATNGRLDIRAWAPYFKAYDALDSGGDPTWRSQCAFKADNFQEGPTSLVLIGEAACSGWWGVCGWHPELYSHQVTWTSVDGLSWKIVRDVAPSEWNPYMSASGGSSGFIVLDGSSIRTSSDGEIWRNGALPSLPTGSTVGNPVAIAGGFVLPGVVTVKAGRQSGDLPNGCTGSDLTDLTVYQAALWWSPDGVTWTRDALTGDTPSPLGVGMTLVRVDDRTVVARMSIPDAATVGTDHETYTETEFVSTDGKTWTVLEGNPLDSALVVVTGRGQGLIWEDNYPNPAPTLRAFDASMTLVTLKQTGDVPWEPVAQRALGPTGLLVTEDGTRFWLGVPTAG